MHFFEALEREVDFQNEYEKAEKMVVSENHHTTYGYLSINEWIEKNFRKWDQRGNYTSFAEVREQIGFPLKKHYGDYVWRNGIDIKQYFLYCEMILTLISEFAEGLTKDLLSALVDLRKTMQATIEKAGFEIREIQNGFIVVEKNAVAIEVAENNPSLADAIIEYNQYLLKGNMQRKKEILEHITHALEPKRKFLESVCFDDTDNYFFLVNNMDIRHNNVEPSDSKNYCEVFANMTNEEKEKWYDTIYEQALALFILENQSVRNNEIKAFRKSLKESK